MARLTLLTIMLGSLIGACTRPCVCNCAGAEVREHVIDSLKQLYEISQRASQPTVTKPATPKPATPKPATQAATPDNGQAEESSTYPDDTYTDKEGNTYPVLTGKNGGRYIMRTSKKTGQPYKSYLK